mmetsp:Transcript_29639/g.44903  ORF Transcript_29639/g.44903 Transcript_29639/m.44903 type:complete len:659 (+) Transcript_29639:535-2511(+)
MESGSLLQEALSAVQKTREESHNLTNKLVIDVYLISKDELDRLQTFQRLVSICGRINSAFSAKTRHYPWFSGGDGPAFAFRVEEKIPHLRAYCWYGSCIADEWTAVAAMKDISSDECLQNCVIEMWDSDDGEGIPLLLIECAMALPRWVDELGPAACQHRCWLVKGEILLIRANTMESIQSTLSLRQALQFLGESKCVEKLPSKALHLIKKRLAPYLGFSSGNTNKNKEIHRTAVLLPRKVAYLLQNVPSLCHCAVASFEQNSFLQKPQGNQIEFDDLVWTTQRMGKTSYAILRNLASKFWPSLEENDCIPSVYKSVEVNRLKRMCKVESTPHLKHALQLGIRITAGLEYIMSRSPKHRKNEIRPALDAEELILKYWTSLDIACGGDGAWLRNAWVAGPNQSPVDLNHFITCPIESIDLTPAYCFPNSHRQKDIKSIIKENLQKKPRKDERFIVPSSNDVDNESWMQIDCVEEKHNDAMLSKLGRASTSENGEEQVEELLDNFKTFVEDESGFEGIASGREDLSAAAPNDDDSLDLDPQLFLNLLHKVMKSTPEEIQNLTTTEDDVELYFGKDDSSLENGNEQEDVEKDINMAAVMEAMDLELNREKIAKDIVDKDSDCDEQVAEDAGVISNLLESLEASNGAPGPVRNILGELKSSK